MKRVSIVTLSLLLPAALSLGPACSSEPDPNDGGNNGQAGTNNAAGTLNTPTAGSAAVAGAGGGMAAAGGSGGAASGGTVSSGTSSGGSTAGMSNGGAATAGSGGVAAAGAATAGSGGGPGGDPSCPVKIDSKVICPAAVTCNDAYCGVFKLGSKDCTCTAAGGAFDCTSCDYVGKTEAIVVPPASALPACTGDDMTLEATAGCTKGDRCRSTDAAKVRFCACWDDPVEGGTAWDCDSMPSAWPK